MDCQSCKERMLPEDPSMPFYMGGGRYLKPVCDTCPRRFTSQETPVSFSPIHTNEYHQCLAQIRHFEGKLSYLLEKEKEGFAKKGGTSKYD